MLLATLQALGCEGTALSLLIVFRLPLAERFNSSPLSVGFGLKPNFCKYRDPYFLLF